jgi:hypothetical protein
MGWSLSKPSCASANSGCNGNSSGSWTLIKPRPLSCRN